MKDTHISNKIYNRWEIEIDRCWLCEMKTISGYIYIVFDNYNISFVFVVLYACENNVYSIEITTYIYIYIHTPQVQQVAIMTIIKMTRQQRIEKKNIFLQ